jgi:hypothetical protein
MPCWQGASMASILQRRSCPHNDDHVLDDEERIENDTEDSYRKTMHCLLLFLLF